MWSEEEGERLRKLRIDPHRHRREKIMALVRHFKDGGTLFSVTDKGEPEHASQEFARKVRDLARQGHLDWLAIGGGSAATTGLGEVRNRLSASEQAPEMVEHRKRLLASLHPLLGIEPISVHDRDLVTWWSKPDVADWPVPKGRAWRRQDSSLEVRLDAESRREWRYLRQHLVSSQVWHAIEDCKKALAEDLAARLTLMDSVAARIQDTPERGGLGLPIEADLGFIPVTRSEVTIYYIFTIYDQVLSRTLGLRHALKRKDEFHYRDPGYPEVVSLGGIPVVRSTDPEVRSRAVSFLLEAQDSLTSLQEVAAAAKAYQAAKATTKRANDEIQDVQLMPGFPPGGACDLCRSWVRSSPARG